MKLLKLTRLFAALCIFGFIVIAGGAVVKAQAISAKSYVLIDQSSGRVIECGNDNMRLPMASTTKIMTALIAVESGRLDDTFTVPPEAILVEGSSMGLQPDEKITLRDLVYGLMLESGNDAANTIATVLGGSPSHFADMMNARALSLGLTNTHFCNPSGLDAANHYTTALDLARLTAYAMNNPDFAKITGTQKIRIPYNGIKNGRLLVNHNRLLGSYADVIGGKTGFTKKSGRCLVSCAQRDGVALVAVTLNDPDDWKDHAALFDSGFSKLKSTKLLNVMPEITANVVGGLKNKVDVVYDKSTTASLKQGELSQVKLQVELDRFYYAPLKKGQILGHMVYTVDGVVVAKTNITAANNVAGQGTKKPGFFARLWRAIAGFFRGLFHR